MSKYFLPIFLSCSYFAYVFVQLFFHEEILEILNNNLPYRQAYFPTIVGIAFVYALPLILGYYISAATDKRSVRNYLYYINLSLVAGIMYFLPYLPFFNEPDSYLFNNLTIAYSLMLFPFLFIVGSMPNIYSPVRIKESGAPVAYVLSRLDFSIAILIGIVSFAINCIPFAISHYLVGADIYYHAAMTNEIAYGHGLFSSPYFLEGTNNYYSIVYYILEFASAVTRVSIQNVWMIYPAVCSGLFFFFFYLFSKKLLGNTFLAVTACFFAFTTRQLIWGDPTVRNASYLFFVIFLYYFQVYLAKKKRIDLFWSVCGFILTITSHPEVAIHIVGILTAYLALRYTHIIDFARNMLFTFQHRTFVAGFYVPALEAPRTFVVQIFLYALVFAASIIFIVQNYSIGQVLIFNEIPLSFLQPLGVISFMVFILFPIGLLKILDSTNNNHLFLLAIASLSFSGIFYFTDLWILYHRYFFETAFFALAIVASFALKDIVVRLDNTFGMRFLGIIGVFIFLSLYPRYEFLLQYTSKTNADLEIQMKHMTMIRNNTLPNDVIVINPRNILNRFLPFYAERYILAGANEVTKDQQWQVLSFCNGAFGKDCIKREDIANQFFASPSQLTLQNVRSEYQANYILLNKLDQDEYTKFSASDLQLILPVAEDDQYALYKL
jgi:hypothetical protein